MTISRLVWFWSRIYYGQSHCTIDLAQSVAVTGLSSIGISILLLRALQEANCLRPRPSFVTRIDRSHPLVTYMCSIIFLFVALDKSNFFVMPNLSLSWYMFVRSMKKRGCLGLLRDQSPVFVFSTDISGVVFTEKWRCFLFFARLRCQWYRKD